MPPGGRILSTEEEDAHMLKLRQAGYSCVQIADSVGKARSTISKRLAVISPMRKTAVDGEACIRTKPTAPAPALPAAVASKKNGWSKELDEQILELRRSGCTFLRIADTVGRGLSSVWKRIMELTEANGSAPAPANPAAVPKERKPRGAGRADFFRQPAGPVPANPDPPASPRDPGYRKCLWIYHRGVPHFWSPSAAVRICPTCKKNASRPDGYGKGRAIADTAEFVLRL